MYVNQLEQLENMGFMNKEINLKALEWAQGDVNGALNYIIGGS